MKKMILLLALAVLFPVFAGEQPPEKPFPKHKKPSRESIAGWRAFANLSAAEREKLSELRRENPEEFRVKMKELAQQQQAKEQIQRDALRKLVDEYRSCKNEEAKEELKDKIENALREDFMVRLQEHKRQLEEMKRRTRKMEEELNRREKQADKAVAARLQNILDGGDPFEPPAENRSRSAPENKEHRPGDTQCRVKVVQGNRFFHVKRSKRHKDT